MNIIEFSALTLLTSLLAGFIGALTGLGGGVIIVPVLTLAFGVDIRYAIGASLISVIATSSGAASAYVKEGYTNLRIGMFLEIATTIGALVGAFIAAYISTSAVGVIFGLVLIYSGIMSWHPPRERPALVAPTRLGAVLKLSGSMPSPQGPQSYQARAVPFGFGLMTLAGAISGLLGIGSGAFKVLAMDQVMRIPFKVSTTTSNFMIGVTAAASAGVYLSRGYIDPELASPVMLGVLAGSLLGARLLIRTASASLRKVFVVVILVMAFEMIYNAIAGRL
jgi:uncharacterized protein